MINLFKKREKEEVEPRIEYNYELFISMSGKDNYHFFVFKERDKAINFQNKILKQIDTSLQKDIKLIKIKHIPESEIEYSKYDRILNNVIYINPLNVNSIYIIENKYQIN